MPPYAQKKASPHEEDAAQTSQVKAQRETPEFELPHPKPPVEPKGSGAGDATQKTSGPAYDKTREEQAASAWKEEKRIEEKRRALGAADSSLREEGGMDKADPQRKEHSGILAELETAARNAGTRIFGMLGGLAFSSDIVSGLKNQKPGETKKATLEEKLDEVIANIYFLDSGLNTELEKFAGKSAEYTDEAERRAKLGQLFEASKAGAKEGLGFSYKYKMEGAPQLPNEFYKRKEGDCDDFARFYVACATKLGLIQEGDGESTITFRVHEELPRLPPSEQRSELHAAVVVKVGGKFLLIDPSFAVMGEIDEVSAAAINKSGLYKGRSIEGASVAGWEVKIDEVAKITVSPGRNGTAGIYLEETKIYGRSETERYEKELKKLGEGHEKEEIGREYSASLQKLLGYMELEGFTKEAEFKSDPSSKLKFDLESITLHTDLALALVHTDAEAAVGHARTALAVYKSLPKGLVEGDSSEELNNNVYDSIGVVLQWKLDSSLKTKEVQNLDKGAVGKMKSEVLAEFNKMVTLDSDRHEAHDHLSGLWNNLGFIELREGQNKKHSKEKRKEILESAKKHFEMSSESLSIAISKAETQMKSLKLKQTSAFDNSEITEKIDYLEGQKEQLETKQKTILKNHERAESALRRLENEK